VAHSGLGYQLRFAVNELKLDRPSTMRFDVDGDVAGTGVLSFVPTGPRETTVVIDWNVRLTRRWMQRCDPVLRPVFVTAHRVVMRRGERRLQRWLKSAAR